MKIGNDGLPHHEKSVPMASLGFCPFSLVLFAATAATVVYRSHQRREDRAAALLPSCQVVFVLGGPGAGKGTQCQLLTERNDGWTHLSAGDLLRAERKKGGALGDTINECIVSGGLVPSRVVCQLLEKAMTTCYETCGSSKFLIDGFPRSRGNVDAWEDTMSRHRVEFVLVLECPEETLVGRLLERGQTSGRSDDQIDVIRNRLETFRQETAPIVDFYNNSGKVHKIASDKPVEEVYKQVAVLFDAL